ncbi:hypothetical protein RDI58_008329 [Solanum bulbocastanum]|uniref:Uncharacterized protein n=1 Tax=Solanum bulbocastanum TaxID=147425 RepID=A0AAN8YK20_SOLBU
MEDSGSPFQFLTKKPYEPPSWAFHHYPIPSHTFSLEHGADCIVTIGVLQSNHCRATAVSAKYLNLDCYLILLTKDLPVDKDPGFTGNLIIDRLVGAHIDLVSKEKYANVGSELDLYFLPRIYFCILMDPLLGGTVAGLSVASRLSGLKAKVHAFSVCDHPDYFYEHIQGLHDGINAGDSSRDIVKCERSRVCYEHH